MSIQKTISVNDISLCNENSFVLIGGLNVLETKDLAFKVAETFKEITSRLQIPYIFKASFDKANRSSMDSFRGPGMEEGLRILEEVKQAFGIPLLHRHQGAFDESLPGVRLLLVIEARAEFRRHFGFSSRMTP